MKTTGTVVSIDGVKRIEKTFRTMKQAERYQNSLYGRYHAVSLVSFPRFGEGGDYVWEVAKRGEHPDKR